MMGKWDWIRIVKTYLKSFSTSNHGKEDRRAAAPKADEQPRKAVPEKCVDTMLTRNTPIQIVDGKLSIPECITAISPRALENRQELISVIIPGTVKSIGERAFAECLNLKQVIMGEGIERIGSRAFAGCTMLSSIVIPDSVKEINGWAFDRCGLTGLVRNASGDGLYFCPAVAAGAEYVVPEGIRFIGDMAFAAQRELRQVHLPETLERIGKMAFQGCGLREVTIPAGVKEIGDNPFWKCKDLQKIIREKQFDPVRTAVDFFQLQGMPFLVPVRVEWPDDRYWETKDFRTLAQECANGSADAEEKMAVFFLEKHMGAPGVAFYRCAANFWSYRSYEKGNRAAAVRMANWIEASPGKQLPSAFLTERLRGTEVGWKLNVLGFPFFEADREYCLEGKDANGVVTVSAYASEDGPDEDGFGSETYYDWWYLDDNLSPIPEVECLYGYSSIDRRIPSVIARFQESHDRAALAIRLR